VVAVNQPVLRGQTLGTVLQQYFTGRYTSYHDDSHLHFEMRYFYDASAIYASYPSCNGYLPGVVIPTRSTPMTFPLLNQNITPTRTPFSKERDRLPAHDHQSRANLFGRAAALVQRRV